MIKKAIGFLKIQKQMAGLKMARDLLTDDGAIFISIDENEVSNLRKICDEIFGGGNFVCQFIANSAPAGTQSSDHVAIQHSYCLFYAKSINNIQVSSISLDNNTLNEKYKEQDSFGNYYLERLWKRGIGGRKEDVPSLHFPVFYDEANNKIIFSNELANYNQNKLIEIIPYQTKGVLGRWTWSQEHMIKDRHLLSVKEVNGEYKLFKKQYMEFDKGNKIKSIITSDIARTELGSIELKNIMNVKVFDYPKSSKFVIEFLKIYTMNSDIILDFFSGSATTAHAVMQLNAEDGGNRKYIMVQLPAETPEDSEARKAGYNTICEIGKERIRRAGEKIKKDYPNANIDTGFRVFKLDSSNMEDVYYEAEKFSQQDISKTISYIKADRSEEDLLFQIILSCGIPLKCKIEIKKVNNRDVYFVDNKYLLVCFEKDIDDKTIEELAKMQPHFMVFNQNVQDSTLANIKQIFKMISNDTNVKVI